MVIDATKINVKPLGLNGNGGSIGLHTGLAGGGLRVTGSLDARGVGVGNGGSINLVVGGAAFLIGAPSAQGVSGDLLAGAGALGGSGGKIFYFGGPLTVTALSNLSFAATNGHGGSLILGNTNTLPAGDLSADAVGPGNFNGGQISLSTLTSVSGNPLLSANGVGTGNGGIISANGSIGFASNQFRMSADSGLLGGNGGSISIGQTSSVNMAAFSVRTLGPNGNGGSVAFRSNGSLQIVGSINVDGVGTGNGGNVTMITTAANFTVGAPSTNGISGAVSARAGTSGSGGKIDLHNFAANGNMTVTNPNFLSVTATNGRGGDIHLETFGTLTIGKGSLSANGAGNGDGGMVYLYGGALAVSGGGSLSVSADAAGTGLAGRVLLYGGGAAVSDAVGRDSCLYSQEHYSN